MAYKNFSFDPEEGFLDTGFYEDTPSNPREILQRQHNQTKDYINSLVNTLNSKKEGSSGSESIMSPEIAGVSGENVFEQLKDIKRQINDAASLVIPDSSVTEEKLKNNSVTQNKLKDGSVSTEKLSKDAVAPFSEDTLNINGIPSNAYLPLNKTGFSSVFKELVCKEPLESIRGKIYNGKRYFVKDALIHTLDLETAALEKISDVTLPEFSKIAVFNENIIYVGVVSTDSNDRYAYLSLYKYEKEYDELILINKIKLFYAYMGSYDFVDIDVSETHLLFGIARNQNSNIYNCFYKLSLSDIETISEATIYYSFTSSSFSKNFFLFENDVFFGTRIFKDASTEEILTLYAEAKSCDNYGNILTENDCLPICDLNTLLPKFADIYSRKEAFDGFLYNNYYYVLVNSYLFKTKLS